MFSVAGAKIEIVDRRKSRFSLTTLTKRVILLQALSDEDLLRWTETLSEVIRVRIFDSTEDLSSPASAVGSPAVPSIGRKLEGVPGAAISVLPAGPVTLPVLNRNRSASNKFVQDVRPEEIPAMPPVIAEEPQQNSFRQSLRPTAHLLHSPSANDRSVPVSDDHHSNANDCATVDGKGKDLSQQHGREVMQQLQTDASKQFEAQKRQEQQQTQMMQQSQQVNQSNSNGAKKKKSILAKLLGILGFGKGKKLNQEQGQQQQQFNPPQQAPITATSVFGGNLEAQAQKQNSIIPRIVLECIQIIEQKGMDLEGIYRLSGNAGSIQRLRFFYNNYEDFWIDPNYEDWSDVHVITGALKLYFRELQDPLFTFALYDKFMASACKFYTR